MYVCVCGRNRIGRFSGVENILYDTFQSVFRCDSIETIALTITPYVTFSMYKCVYNIVVLLKIVLLRTPRRTSVLRDNVV